MRGDGQAGGKNEEEKKNVCPIEGQCRSENGKEKEKGRGEVAIQQLGRKKRKGANTEEGEKKIFLYFQSGKKKNGPGSRLTSCVKKKKTNKLIALGGGEGKKGIDFHFPSAKREGEEREEIKSPSLTGERANGGAATKGEGGRILTASSNLQEKKKGGRGKNFWVDFFHQKERRIEGPSLLAL